MINITLSQSDRTSNSSLNADTIAVGDKHLEASLGCDRRKFLRQSVQVGSLGFLGLGLPELLQAEQSSESKKTGGAKAKARAKSVVLIYLGGGLSHHDSFDPKSDAPEEIRGKYRPISTNIAGVKVSEMIPMMAKSMQHLALVRSGEHNNDHHETATNWVLSGRFGSAFGDYPAIGAVVAKQCGFSGKIPPYVAIPKNPSFTWELGKSAFLGGRFESFTAGDPNQTNYQVRDLSPPANVLGNQLKRRQSLLQAVDGLSKDIHANDQIDTYSEFQKRAVEMVLASEARQAFAIEREPQQCRDRYGRNTFGQSCLLARRLVQAGVRFVTVNYGGWDHHARIFEGLKNKLPEFDRGLSAFLEDMNQHGLLQDTLVVVMGEFGRSPKINKDGGRDHWAKAGSLLFAGAGVRGGNVIGATDKQGGFVTKRPVSPGDVAYTIYSALGIDPHSQLITPDGRPIEITEKGDVIHELYA